MTAPKIDASEIPAQEDAVVPLLQTSDEISTDCNSVFTSDASQSTEMEGITTGSPESYTATVERAENQNTVDGDELNNSSECVASETSASSLGQLAAVEQQTESLFHIKAVSENSLDSTGHVTNDETLEVAEATPGITPNGILTENGWKSERLDSSDRTQDANVPLAEAPKISRVIQKILTKPPVVTDSGFKENRAVSAEGCRNTRSVRSRRSFEDPQFGILGNREREGYSWRDRDPDSSTRSVITHSRCRRFGSSRLSAVSRENSFPYPDMYDETIQKKIGSPPASEASYVEPYLTDCASPNIVDADGDILLQSDDLLAADVVSPQYFVIQLIVKPGETFLGLDFAHRQSIQAMLRTLTRKSLRELPFRSLKIDQVVLIELMKELVRGKVVEITRHKVQLNLLDQCGVSSATKVYHCPEVIATARPALQEIQLRTPRRKVSVGACVYIKSGKYIDNDRLVAFSHGYSPEGAQGGHFNSH
ncbi:uncharacterized protein LOC100903996 [Galendromus occidentalis]|uniref:Uncharacterized protein LOC100903996 n=1 Tax=Galendromus occidentalis TaxID=34638 RepID=A0AAJ7L4T9_9ACAR|nr:uncharacterized protein LOC100903996 [Galendromus occidentalis]